MFDARLYDEDGDPKGDLAEAAFWETIVPECTFTTDGSLESVELHPCTLQQNRPRQQRAIPVAATGEEADSILESVIELSEPFGTEFRMKDRSAVVELP